MGHDLLVCTGMRDLSCREMAGYACGSNPPYGLTPEGYHMLAEQLASQVSGAIRR
jgi:hypothetical protein